MRASERNSQHARSDSALSPATGPLLLTRRSPTRDHNRPRESTEAGTSRISHFPITSTLRSSLRSTSRREPEPPRSLPTRRGSRPPEDGVLRGESARQSCEAARTKPTGRRSFRCVASWREARCVRFCVWRISPWRDSPSCCETCPNGSQTSEGRETSCMRKPLRYKGFSSTPGGTRTPNLLIRRSPSRVHRGSCGPERRAFESTGVHSRPHESTENGSQLGSRRNLRGPATGRVRSLALHSHILSPQGAPPSTHRNSLDVVTTRPSRAAHVAALRAPQQLVRLLQRLERIHQPRVDIRAPSCRDQGSS